MLIKSIMSSPVVTVEFQDKLEVVNQLFGSAKFHHILVVNNGVLLGVISDRDLLKVISPNIGTILESQSDLDTLNQKAYQIMTPDPICLNENDSAQTAITLFDEHNISCLPVLDDDKKPVGILSWRDIITVIRSKMSA